MAVFYILSGFLITTLLLKDPRVGAFLTRRLLRILPLAWLAMVVVLSRRGLWLRPLLALMVTALRIGHGKSTAINTLYRVDDMLAGCTLALLYTHQPEWARRLFSALPLWGWMALVLASAYPG